ncbi:hypothetical protein, partial [Bradyrhizobium sp. Leo170]|uniref:hypothetical protein n=1 Tax=Bradyrhizobium sp. Leo170 TaxID=1571199 RepID=UPI0013EECED4
KDAENFTPMIFFDRGGYWLRSAIYENGRVTSYGLKMDETVPEILKFGICTRLSPDEAALRQFLDQMAFTDDVSVIKDVLAKHSGVAKRNMSFALAGESFRIPTLRMNRA